MRTRFLAAVVVCACMAAACEVAKAAGVSSRHGSAAGKTSPPNSRFPHTGGDLIAYITAGYPDRLVGGISYENRAANTAFIRDKTIETGICGGMDLGRATAPARSSSIG